MSNGLNANIKLRRALASEWEGVNPILLSGEPGMELDTFKLKIGNGVLTWNELPYITDGTGSTLIYNAIKIVEILPEVGEDIYFYKVNATQKMYYWDSVNAVFVDLIPEIEIPEYPDIPEFVDTNTDNIVICDELPEVGVENLLYKLPD